MDNLADARSEDHDGRRRESGGGKKGGILLSAVGARSRVSLFLHEGATETSGVGAGTGYQELVNNC